MKASLVFTFLFVGCALSQVLNVSELIRANGYPAEDYWVQTSDGFLLSLTRIPYGKNGKMAAAGEKPAILLQHGLLDSAATWIMNSPSESLGYILADNGFDVYLSNSRGNTWSSQNVNFPSDSSALWELVDFDYMASIDLPAFVDQVLALSGRSSLIYVGHSQGTIQGFAAFPLNPELAAKIDLFIALAPVAWVANQQAPMLDFLAELNFAEFLILFGDNEFLPSNSWIQELAGTLCKDIPFVCADIIFLLCGWDTSNLNETRMPIYMSHTPAGTSSRNMYHWSQMVASNKFQMFDYGSASENEAHYNSPVPPMYFPQNLTSPPLAFFTGSQDLLADPIDVQRLIDALPSSNKPFVLNEATYEHLDFVWGENAYQDIYPTLISMALKYSQKN